MKEKGRFLKKYRGNKCLNCSVPLDLIDKYCHHCGQINTTKKLSLKDVFGEFFSNVLSYDSRLRQSISALLLKPGLISREYIKGKRRKYVNPFRFYLSISIIYFVLSGFLDSAYKSFSRGLSEGLTEETQTENKFKKSSPEANKNKDSLKNAIDYSINSKDTKTYYTEKELDSMSLMQSFVTRFDMYEAHLKKTNELEADIALDSLKHTKNQYNQYLYKRAIKLKNTNKNPEELVSFIINNFPLVIFFFLPVFGLVIWLLYFRQPFTYMEHLVFVFHMQTLFFILSGVKLLINFISDSEITLILMAVTFFTNKVPSKLLLNSC